MQLNDRSKQNARQQHFIRINYVVKGTLNQLNQLTRLIEHKLLGVELQGPRTSDEIERVD